MSSHVFSQVPKTPIARSRFDRSHGYKTTFDSGYLVPIFIDEVLPGDTVAMQLSAFLRLATPLHPFMDNLYFDVQCFFVPNRLVWDNWQKFCGEQKNPGDSTDFLVPQIESPAITGFANSSLSDYFGIPTNVPGLKVNSLFHRAYNLIWNEWYRDENLQNSVVVDLDDGPDNASDYVLLKRGKRHDYFTSCLPWPQKGPAVNMPLGVSAPIKLDNFSGSALPDNKFAVAGGTSDGNGGIYYSSTYGSGATIIPSPSNNNLYADLTSATSATINQFREAITLQQFAEKNARGGTRYTEILRSHFGVVSPDARLQRPEFLGGFSIPFMVKPIPQTSSTDVESPQGNLASFAIAQSIKNGFVKSFVEHGMIICLGSVRANLSYQQGLNRKFSRRTKYDFYWPTFANLGEQAVLNKEIYAVGSANLAQDEAVFGYQERYAEYRYFPSQITGQFRSNFDQSLDTWHLAQDFSSLPVLSSAFIQDNPPVERVLAVQGENYPDVLYDSYVNLKCTRPIPVYGVPGLTRF